MSLLQLWFIGCVLLIVVLLINRNWNKSVQINLDLEHDMLYIAEVDIKLYIEYFLIWQST